jgi:hypothetical protein
MTSLETEPVSYVTERLTIDVGSPVSSFVPRYEAAVPTRAMWRRSSSTSASTFRAHSALRMRLRDVAEVDRDLKGLRDPR